MTPYVVAAIAGAVLWVVAAKVSGRREAWDADIYWTTAYPIGIVVSAAAAFLWPSRRAWQFGLTLMLAQAVTLAVTARSFGLLPLGMILFGVLSIPLMATAALVSRWRR